MRSVPVSVMIQFLRNSLWSVLKKHLSVKQKHNWTCAFDPYVNSDLNTVHFDSLYIYRSVTYQTNTTLYKWYNTQHTQQWVGNIHNLTKWYQCRSHRWSTSVLHSCSDELTPPQPHRPCFLLACLIRPLVRWKLAEQCWEQLYRTLKNSHKSKFTGNL